jgi:8-oxo-dGTP diphosphatase
MEKKIGVGFGVMILKNYQVLLGKRHEDPEKADSLLDGAGKWTMPGGKLKFQESFEQGAIRETKEECGIKLNKVSIICVNNDIIDTAHFVTLGLFCDDFEGEPKVTEPDEITEWAWFDLDDLPSLLYFPTEKIIQNFKENKFYLRSLE